MGAKYQALKGMEDILPGEIEKWQWLEAKTRIFFESRGFKEIRTPILEPTELFVRSVGEGSDIVHKQMLSFKDRGERNISLRPEMTASVARAVIEHGLLKQAKSLRLYYLGPMFRAERPQAGRKRQFHQIGVEIINEGGVTADFEGVSLLYHFLRYVGLEQRELKINNLGDRKYQEKASEELRQIFLKNRSKLCSDCQWRLEKNVLRIFDCKAEDCQALSIVSTWDRFPLQTKEWDQLRDSLDHHGIKHRIIYKLVRGLDYYNGVVFEVAAEGLGAQDAVAAGGRYDDLYESLGGGKVPATGFSIGMERLLTALEETRKDFAKGIGSRRVYFASLVPEGELRRKVMEQILLLTEAGFAVEQTSRETSLSTHLKRANQIGVRYVVICGEDELKRGKLSLKDLEKRTQKEVAFNELISTLKIKD